MAQNIITAGDATNSGISQTGGNDGTLALQVGPAGTKVTAISMDAAGKASLLVPPVNAAVPAFSAYMSSSQTLGSGVATKLQFQTKEFDVTGAYDNATNFRFQPNVSGYYQINASFIAATTYTTGNCQIYKNGSAYKSGPQNLNAGTGVSNAWGVTGIVYLNGSTDYVEIVGTMNVGQGVTANSSATYFQGILIARSA